PAIEHLRLIASLHEDAAVAAILAVAADHCWICEDDVELHVAEFFFGGDIAAAQHDFHVAVLDLPAWRAGPDRRAGRHDLCCGLPVREVFAVEEDDGVGRGVPVCVFTWRYYRRMRARGIVYVPLLAGNEWSVRVAEVVVRAARCSASAWRRGVLRESCDCDQRERCQ